MQDTEDMARGRDATAMESTSEGIRIVCIESYQLWTNHLVHQLDYPSCLPPRSPRCPPPRLLHHLPQRILPCLPPRLPRRVSSYLPPRLLRITNCQMEISSISSSLNMEPMWECVATNPTYAKIQFMVFSAFPENKAGPNGR